MAARKLGNIPTVSQIVHDKITQIAARYWAPYTADHKEFDAKVVAEIYHYELLQSNFAQKRVMLLEFSQYLECFLWPNYDVDSSSLEHVLSIVVMVNEKFRERVPAWNIFQRSPEQFGGFFKRVMESALMTTKELSLTEQTHTIIFLINCVGSVEVDLVRSQLQKIVGFAIWENLLENQRLLLFKKNPRLKKLWNALQKNDAKLTTDQLKDAKYARRFFFTLLNKFANILDKIPTAGEIERDLLHYCERFLELLIDIESLLPTRRFFNALLDASHVICKCRLSNLSRRPVEGKLFCQLLEILEFYAQFEIDDSDGEPLSDSDVTGIHYANVTALQKAACKSFKEELREFWLANVSSVDTRNGLLKQFINLSKEKLYQLLETLCVVPLLSEKPAAITQFSTELLLEILVYRHQRRIRLLDMLNEMPLYPTQDIIWDENLVPMEYFNGEGCLALNKLNLQFLTIYDYLLRNFQLFRLESTYEIRQDIEDVLFRMKPWKHEHSDKEVVFGGWARMALPISSFSIIEVLKPNIGERSPASVRADISITLSTRPDLRAEWEALRKHDACFLVTVRPKMLVGSKYDVRLSFRDQIQVAYVRGCEIEGMLDADGKVIEEFAFEKKPQLTGNVRTYRVWLDSNQYRLDMERNVKGDEDIYETFNVIIRRKPKENNFKAVLDTIRQLMNTSCVVPAWLHDILLGYGDPGAAHYSKLPNVISALDFNDTFLDWQHVKQSFPDYEIILDSSAVPSEVKADPVPPFRLKFFDLRNDDKKGSLNDDKLGNAENTKRILVQPYVIPSRGPYPYLEPKRNSIRFTVSQIEAIKSGMQPGLTMVVGPPGTGKTDVAVQIISNLYHNWPEQRTLLITHSNQALNQLFEKIMQLDIDERHLLRLGYGEEALETEKDFSRYGRVNYVLAKRLELLKEVERLQNSLGVPGDVSYTCETAGHFYLYQVYARWEDFLNKIQRQRTALLRSGAGTDAGTGTQNDSAGNNAGSANKKFKTSNASDTGSSVGDDSETANADPPNESDTAVISSLAEPNSVDLHDSGTADTISCSDLVQNLFPFTQFFANAPQPLFKKRCFEEDFEIAQGCWRHLSRMFRELDEFRAFELLRLGRDRTEYLLVKEAKIIAMTCTHAALKRKDLVSLGFRYDNVLMEEAAQILEIETFIPLLLQEPQDGRNRLKRWIMIGDHHQLPPVIKNMAFQKYCNMEQSLFTRLVRLGCPTVDLDMQGRARSSIASLYTWRYKKLLSLPHVEATSEFKRANAGFVFDYQFIDVEDFNGIGESAPSPYFYQNLAEAEYAVAIFMYMRLIGYPADKISIITTYNGQKHLIRDIVQRRCSSNPLIGRPRKVTTVDKYQGQQNDYIILSLVRTATVGHIRDVRRLVVALSRSRLGLYILGRLPLFRNCFELTPAFNILCKRPNKLLILPNEPWPSQRPIGSTDLPMEPMQIENMSHMAQFVFEFYKANENSLIDIYMRNNKMGFYDEKLPEEPYEGGGKIDSGTTISAEAAQQKTGARIEKDIEFEIFADERQESTVNTKKQAMNVDQARI